VAGGSLITEKKVWPLEKFQSLVMKSKLLSRVEVAEGTMAFRCGVDEPSERGLRLAHPLTQPIKHRIGKLPRDTVCYGELSLSF